MARKRIEISDSLILPNSSSGCLVRSSSRSIGRGSSNRNQARVMKDIMYYLRKLLQLARKASAMSLAESFEVESIEDEFMKLKEEIDCSGFIDID